MSKVTTFWASLVVHSVVKNLLAKAGETGSIPALGGFHIQLILWDLSASITTPEPTHTSY